MVDQVNVKFGGDTRDLEGAVDRVKGKFEGLGSPISSLTSSLAKFGLSAAAIAVAGNYIENAIGKVSAFVSAYSDLGEAAQHASVQIGASTEVISTFWAAAGAAGVGHEAAVTGLARLETNMAQAAAGTGEASAAFRALGVSVTAADGGLKTIDAILPEIAEKLAGAANGPEKTAIAMAILGRAGVQMLPMLNEGAAGLDHFQRVAQETGTVITGPMAEGMAKTNEAIFTLGEAATGVGITFYQAFKPAIDATVNGLIELVESFNNGIKAGGALNPILTRLTITLDIIVGAIAIASSGFQQLWQIAYGVVEAIQNLLFTLARSMQAAFSLDWGEVEGAWSAGADKIVADIDKRIAAFQVAGSEWTTTVRDLFSNIKAVDNLNVIGVDTSGGPATPQPNKAKLPALGDASNAPSQMDAWRGELQARLMAEQAYFADSRAEELSFWQGKLALTKAGSKERLAVEGQIYTLTKGLAQQGLADDLAALRHKQQMAKEDYDTQLAVQNEKLAALARTYGADSRQYLEVLREKERMERDHLEVVAQMELEAANTRRKIQSIDIDMRRQDLDLAVQYGSISNQQRIAQLRELSDAEYRLSRQGLEQQAQLPGQSPQEVQKVYDQIETLTAQHTADLARLNRDAAIDARNSWVSIVSPISQAFATITTGIIQGTTTLGNAWRRLGQSIVLSMLNTRIQVELDWLAGQAAMALGAQEWANRSVLAWLLGEQTKTAATAAGATARGAAGAQEEAGFLVRVGRQIAQWLGLETAKTAGTVAEVGVRTATEEAAAITGAISAKILAATEIPAYAGIGAAAAMASVAAIPFVGWAMAPAVGAEHAAMAMSFLALASAAGGWGEVPFDGAMTELHKEEMVLPAKFANPLRDMLLSPPAAMGLPGGLAAPGAAYRAAPAAAAPAMAAVASSPTVNLSVQAVDAASFGNLLQRSSSPLMKAIKRAVGNGATLQPSGRK